MEVAVAAAVVVAVVVAVAVGAVDVEGLLPGFVNALLSLTGTDRLALMTLNGEKAPLKGKALKLRRITVLGKPFQPLTWTTLCAELMGKATVRPVLQASRT